jgi:hypothetical protein
MSMKRKCSQVFFVFVIFFSLACSAGEAIPLFAVPTLPPTLTAMPSLTPSPALAPTLTSTPTLIPLPPRTSTPRPAGLVQTAQTDGVLVSDYDAGLAFQISSQWMVIPVSINDLQNLSRDLLASNPDLARSMKSVTGSQGSLRLMALNQNPETLQETMVTNLSVIMHQDAVLLSYPMDVYVEQNVQQLRSAVAGMTVLSSGVYQNINGVEYGMIEFQLQANTAPGTSVTAYEKLVFVKTSTAMSTLTFAAPDSKRETVTPIFDVIINSIQVLP